ncbi:MAG TPA: hypothetical protein VH143_01850 [Kofleriaceae bacterium]|jgi:hypothetical protein|nr:hypothetical protein [Kofleriaceae bacterium]
MSLRLSLLALAGLAGCTTGWGKSSLPPEQHGPLKPKITTGCPPAEFDLAAVAHGGLGVDPQPKVKELRVLAWKESARDADLYADEVLFLAETVSDGFVIAHVARPNSDEWQLVPGDDSFSGSVTTPAAPTHDQFERFLNQSKWNWTKGKDSDSYTYTLLSFNVCSDAWQKSFGEAPWHQFAPEKAADAPAS